ncbi:clpS [Symbiodinium natans]|uniref:ClpS protein n=1 Tax=Symbiodinium natans TaxID=878477 RepID=A0A812HYB1_9DINO|nr:clpS [Symbiodinium natans]
MLAGTASPAFVALRPCLSSGTRQTVPTSAASKGSPLALAARDVAAGTGLLFAASFAARYGRRGVARRAVDMPVKEPPVTTTVAIPGAKVEEDTKQKRADEYRLVLYNDPLNKREFVARCLMTICLLKEGDAYQVMMKAHREGVAVVGTYSFETAEAYCDGLKSQGLSVDIFPVDKDE